MAARSSSALLLMSIQKTSRSGTRSPSGATTGRAPSLRRHGASPAARTMASTPASKVEIANSLSHGSTRTQILFMRSS